MDDLMFTPVDEEKMNNQYKKLLDQQKKANEPHQSVMKEQPHVAPNNSGRKPDGPFKTGIMKQSDIISYLEAIQEELGDIAEREQDDIMGAPAGMPTNLNHDELIDELNRLCTPMLVMQSFENDIADKAMDGFQEAGVYSEANSIQFDNTSRMAQLIAISALLIARKKNTEKWQTYVKASQIARQSKLDIQRDEYDEAKALATQYLVRVSTTNNSSVARQAASDLLPETQH